MGDNRFASSARAAILDALKNRKRYPFLNNRDTYGRTLSDGEAALHAVFAISQTDNAKNSKETITIPKWVFDALVSSWRVFLLVGSSKEKKMTLGQVFGCEPIKPGGREGAAAAQQAWSELRVYGLAKCIQEECQNQGVKLSQEELVGAVADVLAEDEKREFPRVSDATIARYLKKYRSKR